jgi:hypothetical protein
MKCIKEVKSGLITRVEDEKAHRLVVGNTHSYISKSEWKKMNIPLKVEKEEVKKERQPSKRKFKRRKSKESQ